MRTRRVPQASNREQRGNMFSHVMIGTNDLDRAKTFYDAVLSTLGTKPGAVDRHRIFWRNKGGTFSVTKPIDGKDATCANGGTIGFLAETTDQVDAFHKAGLANGGTIGFAAESIDAANAFHAAGLAHGATTCEDPPGIREGSGVKLYIAYLRDPCGNKICALHRIPA